MRLDKHLPPNAIQIRYVHPYYEGSYDEDDNFIEEYCSNEDTATDVYKLMKKAHKEKQSYYYRRRTQDLSSEDTRNYSRWVQSINKHKDKPQYDIKVRKLGRRVVIEYNPEHALKMWKMSQHADKPRHTSKIKIPRDLRGILTPQDLEQMFVDMDNGERFNEHE
tara:strand:- start:1274 stop:1765 length:492 start_codon:yes stop_codon:yes gene_type:complete